MKRTNHTSPSPSTSPSTSASPRVSRIRRRHRRVLIGVLVLAAASAATSCSITIDGFAQEAATELGHDVGEAVTAAAVKTGRATNDYDLVAAALHTVVELDDYDDDDYRPTHSGLADNDGDGLDDDSKVEISVAGARACLTLDGVVGVDDGRCSG